MIKTTFLLVITIYLCHGTELGLDGLNANELKEIEKEIAAGNVPPNYTAEKPKRGAKQTNSENLTFNQLSSANAKQQFNQLRTTQAQPQQQPYRFVYTQPSYVSPNPYLQYYQNPQPQVAYQPVVPHYLQTPTQIQYVSPPSYSQVPSQAFKVLTSKTPSADPTQQKEHVSTQQQQQPLNTAAAQQTVPYYQPMQQYVMILVPPQAQTQHQSPFIYPGYQQQMYLFSQHPLLGYYNQQRLQHYNNPNAQQVTYLTIPGTQQQQGQAVPAVTNEGINDSQKLSVQQTSQDLTSGAETFGARTKA